MGIFRLWPIFVLWALNGPKVVVGETFQYLPEMETVALKPLMRAEPYSATLYTLHTNTIEKLIENVLVFDSIEEYQTLPYVVAFEERRTLGHEGQIAYTKGLRQQDDYAEYSLLRPGREIRHPFTNEHLGFEAFTNGIISIKTFDDPQKVFIQKAFSAIELNARLVPLVGIDLPAVLDIRYPSKPMSGYIVGLQQDVFGGGEYTSVIISLGAKDGLKQGHALDIVDIPSEVSDINTRGKVQLPSKKVGEVLIYKVGQKMSLAIITYSNRTIILNDKVSVGELGS